MFGPADAEADADRQRRLLAEPADVVDELGGSAVRSPVMPATET